MANILIVGAGYVGLSLLALLSRRHFVYTIDKDPTKVALLRKGEIPINDPVSASYFASNALTFQAGEVFPADLDFAYVILCLPTDYSEEGKSFDTSALDSCFEEAVKRYRKAAIVIKSTVPSGYCQNKQNRHKDRVILFSPEFLRESHSLSDNLRPSRIVVGHDDHEIEAAAFAEILRSSAQEDAPVLLTGLEEAEAIKLFSNAYLALRVSYFNELDGYAMKKGLDAASLVAGVCLDPRIGDRYNNPSFGYGGYCLPKDTKQLAANFGDIPSDIITAAITANGARKQQIAERARALAHGQRIGIYRLIATKGSKSLRSSASIDVLRLLADEDIVIYEPTIEAESYLGKRVNNDLASFCRECDLILANRMDEGLAPVKEKVFTRDLSKEEQR